MKLPTKSPLILPLMLLILLAHATVCSQAMAQEVDPKLKSDRCLRCHGGPKGERDISGYTKEGGKEGELAGAISVKLPLP